MESRQSAMIVPAWGEDLGAGALNVLLRPLQLLMALPSLLFVGALTAMLLRHPDVGFYQIDRVVFCLLVMAVAGRAVLLRQKFPWKRASWPMLCLSLLALASVAQQPFDSETWSLLASKFIVPFTLFHFAELVFIDEAGFRHFEIFAVVVLAYLSFTAIAFLVGANALIFPRFILDTSLGFHANRARGPFLQAVANGVSINLLGIIALHAYRRGSLRGTKMLLLLGSLPLAILATMTRMVWLSFAGTALALALISKNRALRIAGALAVVLAVAGVVTAIHSDALGGRFGDRLEDRSPVDFRKAMYAGGWEMFLQRPVTGWGFHRMPSELPHYVSGYQEKVLYPHNTYLELLVEHGVIGFSLYLWLMWELWRLGRGTVSDNEKNGFLNCSFRQLWPILLLVYWINAAVVVMSYQFVNGLLFTVAGMLAAQQPPAEWAKR